MMQRPAQLLVLLSALVAVSVYVSQRHVARAISLENGEDERALEDSFFDSLAAKDKALSDGDKSKTVTDPWKGKAKPVGQAMRQKNKQSMKEQFKQAQMQLAKEKRTMHKMEESDRVKADEQRTTMQRMRAAKEARAYEEHLERLNDKVFPHEHKATQAQRMLDATFSIRHALTDGESHHANGRAATPAHAKATPRTIKQMHHAVHRKLVHQPAAAAVAAPHVAASKAAAAKSTAPQTWSEEFSAYHKVLETASKALLGSKDDSKASKQAKH